MGREGNSVLLPPYIRCGLSTSSIDDTYEEHVEMWTLRLHRRAKKSGSVSFNKAPVSGHTDLLPFLDWEGGPRTQDHSTAWGAEGAGASRLEV